MSCSGSSAEKFELAANYLKQIVGDLSSEQLLYFYARFKQVKEGPCNIPKPGFFDFQGKQKWQAWKDLGDLSKEQAQEEYVKEMVKIDPLWETKAQAEGVQSGSSFGGVAVSTMSKPDDDLPDNEKTVFDWCKECKVKQMAKLLKKADINKKDEEGMTLLHWAADRGHLPVTEYLLQQGAGVNEQDADGQTALHYAASCGHLPVVRLLLKYNTDTAIKDGDGLTAENIATDLDIIGLLKPS